MTLALRLFLFLFIPISDFEGKVVGVIDGDTIDVLRSGKSVRIRLNGIDCPERSQAFGNAAKQYMSSLLFQKQVNVKVKGSDKYGRIIADIYLPDGTWVNKKLVAEGLAWHYKYYSNNKDLSDTEINARNLKKGLWIEKHPIEPWNYRHKIKN